MECKTGADHIASLKDGRTVCIDGALVDDVTTHPAYRNAGASAAMLRDYQAQPENQELMTFVPDRGGRRVNCAWQMPRSDDELVQRRKALPGGRGCPAASWAARCGSVTRRKTIRAACN